MKLPYLLLIVLPITILSRAVPAQNLFNNGAVIALTGGAMLYTSGSLTNSSGTLDLSNGSNQLTVGGNLINASGATLTPGPASTVTLNGAAAQQLTLDGITLANLTISNTGGDVSLPGGVTTSVAGTLTLTSGFVNVDPSATLLLLDGATLSGEQSTSYVKGPLAARRASVPSGVATAFPNSFAITPTTPLLNLTVTRWAGLRRAQTTYGTSASGNKGIDRVWTTSATVAGQLSLSWLSDNDNGLTKLTQSQPWARAAAPVAGSDWTLVGASQDASSSRTVQATTPAGSSFSFFTVSTSEAPLPVTLVAFAAQRQGADGLLTWTTASELNNAYFQVESSVDGTTFAPLGRVAGAGTSSQAHSYQFVDANLARYAVAQLYYRLRQVDTSSDAAYSPVRAVAVPLAAGFAGQAYPNPSQPAAEVQLSLRTNQDGPATLWLTDVLGRQLSQQQVVLHTGTTTLPLVGVAELATGVYLLHLRQGTQQLTLKLVRH